MSDFDQKTFQDGIKNIKSREEYFELCEKSGIKNAERLSLEAL